MLGWGRGMLQFISMLMGRATGAVGFRLLSVDSWRWCRLAAWAIVMIGGCAAAVRADETRDFSEEQLAFFETRIRPLLVDECFECHSDSSETVRGGLQLDSREALLRGGDSGPGVVPGKPEGSLILQAVLWQSLEMPPRGRLQQEQVDAIRVWIEMGVPWSAATPSPSSKAAEQRPWSEIRRSHWSWSEVHRPAVPEPDATGWCSNEIDQFVISKLRKNGLEPSQPADGAVLLRRLYYDLTGLPPAPARVTEFLAAEQRDRQQAVDAVIEELLASPQYGERWGRFWLDVARYSDGFGGFLDSAALPHAWRYRDWVVESLNADRPMDDFLRRQIAGDLMDPAEPVATGFFALGPTYISDGGDPLATAQARSETLDDRVDTLTRGLLGLTVSCARCHDHKFDPIPQQDYYSLAGIFNNTQLHEAPLAEPAVLQAHEQHQRLVRETEVRLKERQENAARENRSLTEEETRLKAEDEKRLEDLKSKAPAPLDLAHSLRDSGAADMAVAIRGNLLKPGAVVPRRMPGILFEHAQSFATGSGRMELAEAMVSRTNPLTARVLVNRVWAQHFGFGLVRTPGNFGVQGEQPTHPELLDWLSAEFMEGSMDSKRPGGVRPWSLKDLHRLILRSSTWQMSSVMNESAFAVDADNRLLWRMNPRRLDIESWRDTLLFVTGELDTKVGGPPVDSLLESRRRTLYGAISRNGDRFASDAFLRLFDFPLPRATSEGRRTSVIPQQALFLMNSPFMAERARAFAARLEAESSTEEERVKNACLLLFGRNPSAEEQELARAFLSTSVESTGSGKLNVLQQYAQVLLSSNELMHLR